jgi:hypothetical protein
VRVRAGACTGACARPPLPARPPRLADGGRDYPAHGGAPVRCTAPRYLDDKAWLENRRVMEILREIEARALEIRDRPPEGPVMELDEMAPDIRLVMRRPGCRRRVTALSRRRSRASGAG